MHADHRARAARACRDGIDVERRGVGREHRIRGAQRTELRENVLLDRETLEHGFDHEIRRGKGFDATRRTDALAGRGGRGGVQPALVDARGEHALHALHARRKRPRVAIDQRDRKARGREIRGDARPHGARAHHTDGAHAARRRAALRLALGEEQVAQRARRLGATTFLEAAARQRQRCAEGLATGGRHAVDDGIDGCNPRKLALCRGTFARQPRGIRRAARHRAIAQTPLLEVGCLHLPREAAGLLEQIQSAALAVDDAEGKGTLEVDGIAAEHTLERRRGADQPRQPLRPARSRQQAEAYLR
jgi:hypothetical protein